MLKVRYSAKFKKDFKAIVKRGYDITLFEDVVGLLREEKTASGKMLRPSVERRIYGTS